MDGSRPAVDLRSDTVTRPTPEMRRAMAAAEVGDDVYGEDPTVRALEEEAAALLGFPAALFVPTGTMGNQVALHLLARRGEDVIVEEGAHVYRYELGALAAWTGAVPRAVAGERGHLTPALLETVLPPPAYYMARAAALVIENTANHAGGTVLPPAAKDALVARARAAGLAVHLDGARVWNAAAALGIPERTLAAGCDTAMVSLSKGLGAPVGSLFLSSAERVAEGRVVRKRMGGGMRQAGILAAAGRVALSHRPRLAEDHARARHLAEGLAGLPGFRIDPARVETNIVIAEVDPPAAAPRILDDLKAGGVLAGGMGPGRIRFVTHLDVDDAGLARALTVLRSVRVY